MNTISNDDQQYRRAAIDYAKALGIIVVVIGHYSNNIFNVMTPYMYHMPLFFMIGGIVFNENKNPLQFLSIIIRKFFFYSNCGYVFIASFISYTREHWNFRAI